MEWEEILEGIGEILVGGGGRDEKGEIWRGDIED